MTKGDKYKPTAAEKKLLEVLINPEFVGLSVKNICNLAGVSRNKYYDAMKKPAFQELVKNTTLELVKGKIGNVLNATYAYALGEKGHQDRKILLTMAGLYVDKQDVNHSGSVDISSRAKEIDDYLNGDTS
ncbi:phBC6A51 family helix-turn-helix protein [Oceanobacillus neutriphilus]|uniref:Homeodomain phBC6A51-type domain-containing protein n=1 Tax=Oceanobacillus neutriphilus TaxID=531815 RepID=A0ABQ2NQ57_9BACI|nr:phBC6A51 family helix-turn-helix protein [Oceanobacillus neutriphilus]GGP07302.1 hypothetical protein GCM10011346_02750 [Oceanobacillus neutriphilus]